MEIIADKLPEIIDSDLAFHALCVTFSEEHQEILLKKSREYFHGAVKTLDEIKCAYGFYTQTKSPSDI